MSDLVFNEFNPNIHIIEPFIIPKSWYDNISIDAGLVNPLSCHFYAKDNNNNIYVIAEYYKANKCIEYHSNKIIRLAIDLDWKFDNQGKLHTIIDSAANQRALSGSKSVCELFYDRGIICDTTVNKNIFKGIAAIKQALNENRLFIFNNCTNMIKEFESYCYIKESNIPIKQNDNAMDDLRYYITKK